MAKNSLTWYKSQATKLMKLLKAEDQSDLADLLNVESRQVISYRLLHCYQKQLEDWIRLLDQIGYQIKEKENLENDGVGIPRSR